MSVIKNIGAIAQGMTITLKEMFQPSIVENYPDGPGPLKGAKFQERFRGMHVLQRDENGLEKCVACFLCAAACPANCIYIEAAENTAEKRVSGAERYARVYNIDYNRCIFCGYCVEACPTDAITHGHGFELAIFQCQQSDLPQRTDAGAGSGAYGSQSGVCAIGNGSGREGKLGNFEILLPNAGPQRAGVVVWDGSLVGGRWSFAPLRTTVDLMNC